MAEYLHYNGEEFVTFDILQINQDKHEVEVAITNRGKITVISFDILTDENGDYIEYGPMYDKIYLKDFEEEPR